jgi:hypothetical protein
MDESRTWNMDKKNMDKKNIDKKAKGLCSSAFKKPEYGQKTIERGDAEWQRDVSTLLDKWMRLFGRGERDIP